MSLMRIPKPIRLIGLGLLSLILVACPQQQPPPPSPSADFTLALNPTSLTVEQGQAGNTTLTLTPRNGFTGQVNLSLVGAPQGVTLEPASVNVTGANPVTQALTVRVAGSTPAGTYSLKVRAASGGLSREANFTLVVTATQRTQITVTAEGGNPYLAYYRLGNGDWQPLTFTGGQAIFYAQGEYEVLVACPYGSRLFKASSSRVQKLNAVCMYFEDTNPYVNVTLEFSMPSSIGSVEIQDGDLVWVSGQRTATSFSGGMATQQLQVPPGKQPLIVTVHRLEDPQSLKTTPIGGKVVEVDIPDSQAFVTIPIDASGYIPFTQKRIQVEGVDVDQANALYSLVDFAKNSGPGSIATYVGFGDKYGTFPASYGGVYLGQIVAGIGGNQGGQVAWIFEDTGGNDWNIRLPDPWPSQSIRVRGSRIELAYPQAEAYILHLRALRTNRNFSAVIFPSDTPTTTYTLPESLPEGFNYDRNEYLSGDVELSVTAWVSGWDQPLARWVKEPIIANSSFTFNGYPLSEDRLRGTRIAFRSAYTTYSNGDLTWP